MMEHRFFFLLDRAHHLTFTNLDRLARQRFGIPLAQLAALWAMKESETLTMAVLGKRMKLKNSAMTGLVRRLQNNGLVRQFSNPEDGRSFLIALTEEGRQIRKVSLPLVSTFNQQLTEGFSKDELDVVARFLDKLMKQHEPKKDSTARSDPAIVLEDI